ncbi:N-acetyl-gamma-glutamyl-phosphate reductase [Cephaloticoccus primus]|uniref:N-acetyl-gamma-glutamyl-phosphate reductase n=1 Tax=Cephaloticoccus primus TaxID=1548207 RepID=A0A139SUE0_9BACT|nr:N-acetyl-gamma-glutamyl-phosphate reductase [Cephaloticoccus primus]KXU38206.1 N-acetyl-gamma-glutamyl-phosphate reductase [Cephaloticoccus primus]
MKVGVVGASGYTGELLVQLLIRHPAVELAVVTSRAHAGKPLSAVIPMLRGADRGLVFVDSDPAALAASDCALFFLALPHGAAATYARALVAAGKRVIDLSADFRIADLETYTRYYGEHQAPELLPHARYVLPEITAPSWRAQAKLVAAPGCYPTSILVPLVPLLRAGLVSREHIVANSFSGVSGAGKKAEEAYLYVERAESAKAYGLTSHRHLAEIEEQLSLAVSEWEAALASRAADARPAQAHKTGQPLAIQFNPHLAPMRRGIATTITVPAAPGASLDALRAVWAAAYAEAPFVQLLAEGQTPDTAHVVGTNRIDIAAAYDPRTRNFVLTSAEDNLLKGAGGQAVQIMNLWCGFAETAGLA